MKWVNPSSAAMQHQHLQPTAPSLTGPPVLGSPPKLGGPPIGHGVLIAETTRPLNSASAVNAGLPVLVEHSSSLVAPQPVGRLIPTNVRPPQCLAAAGNFKQNCVKL